MTMWSKKKTTTTLAATILVALLATPAVANDTEVTDGSLITFAEGDALGYEVGGFARMVRTPNQTIVIVMAHGLEPGLTYGSHVHNQPCDQGNAGGHYSFGEAVPGGALDGSEIWPGPFTARPNGTASGKTLVGAVAGSSAVSVVIHAPGGAKIACADLT
ncbi:MAG: hypothetical protein WAL25_01545 [Acidimicrobiia bacterium]